MVIQKIIILAINLLGGMAVIGSYIFGLVNKSGGANALWGGTPVGVRSIYTFSMVLAALGYFAFMYFILFKLDPSSANFNVLYLIFFGILAVSAFWMPLSNLFLDNPSTDLWVCIRLVLAVVGISSLALVWFLVSLHAGQSGAAYWLAVAGSSYFTFHTLFLDAILWPIFFKM
jgi:hypothetical protein